MLTKILDTVKGYQKYEQSVLSELVKLRTGMSMAEKKAENDAMDKVSKDISVLAEKIDITKYFPNDFMNENFVKKCSILPNYNKINGSDYISVNYRGRKFVYCDLLLEWETRERDSDGHRRTRTTTQFQGYLMKMELGKDIEDNLF